MTNTHREILKAAKVNYRAITPRSLNDYAAAADRFDRKANELRSYAEQLRQIGTHYAKRDAFIIETEAKRLNTWAMKARTVWAA